MNTWIEFLASQWWVFALIGSAAVLAYLIRGKSDEEALKLLSNKLWGAGAGLAAWYALQMQTSNPHWGVVVGAGITFAVLTFVPLEYQRIIVSSENWGKFLIGLVAIGAFVVLIMPTMKPSELINLVIGALVVGAIYLWSERKKLHAMIKVEKPIEKNESVVEGKIVEE